METEPIPGENLTNLQRRFAEEYLIDLNATQAAKRAGSKADRLDQAGYEFLSNPEVQEYIQVLIKKRSEKTEMTAAKLLDMLVDEATADIADIYDEDGMLKPVHEWPLVFRRGLVAGIEVETKYERRGDDVADIGRVAKIKMADRNRIKDMIGRHVMVQAFKENIGVSGGIAVASVTQEQLAKMTPEQLHALASIPTGET